MAGVAREAPRVAGVVREAPREGQEDSQEAQAGRRPAVQVDSRQEVGSWRYYKLHAGAGAKGSPDPSLCVSSGPQSEYDSSHGVQKFFILLCSDFADRLRRFYSGS